MITYVLKRENRRSTAFNALTITFKLLTDGFLIKDEK
jgi:hypothetical protein